MMAGFVPVQGDGQWPEQLVMLHGEDVGLRIDESLPIDRGGLREALTWPRTETWSGVRFGRMEPFDDLFLWLVTRSSTVCLLTRKRTEAARAMVDELRVHKQARPSTIYLVGLTDELVHAFAEALRNAITIT